MITWKLIIFLNITYALTVLSKSIEYDALNNETNETNGSAKDLYLIKTIVYEVGILTDANNETDNETETHEQVDLTFFDPIKNGSVFDLSNIPIPIQTNISGVSITGIAPANLGRIELPGAHEESATFNTNFPLQVPLLPNALINVKENITTLDELSSVQLLEKLPDLLHFNDPITGIPLEINKTEV